MEKCWAICKSSDHLRFVQTLWKYF